MNKIYELKIEKKNRWTEFFYLYPVDGRLEVYYKHEDGHLSKTSDGNCFEHGQNLNSGGSINIRTLVEKEYEEIFKKIE